MQGLMAYQIQNFEAFVKSGILLKAYLSGSSLLIWATKLLQNNKPSSSPDLSLNLLIWELKDFSKVLIVFKNALSTSDLPFLNPLPMVCCFAHFPHFFFSSYFLDLVPGKRR